MSTVKADTLGPSILKCDFPKGGEILAASQGKSMENLLASKAAEGVWE